MKYSIEMDSGVMLYIPSFIKIASCIQQLLGGTQADTQQGDLVSHYLFFSKIREVG
jgi:hypothetical protein